MIVAYFWVDRRCRAPVSGARDWASCELSQMTKQKFMSCGDVKDGGDGLLGLFLRLRRRRVVVVRGGVLELDGFRRVDADDALATLAGRCLFLVGVVVRRASFQRQRAVLMGAHAGL